MVLERSEEQALAFQGREALRPHPHEFVIFVLVGILQNLCIALHFNRFASMHQLVMHTVGFGFCAIQQRIDRLNCTAGSLTVR